MHTIIIALSVLLPAALVIWQGRKLIWDRYGEGEASTLSVIVLLLVATAVGFGCGYLTQTYLLPLL